MAVAEAYLAALQARTPALEVDTIDLWEENLPDFDGNRANAKLNVITGAAQSETQRTQWDEITAIAGPSLTIWPPIRESPADGQGIAITGTQGVWRLKSNSRKWSVAVNKLYSISFELREAL